MNAARNKLRPIGSPRRVVETFKPELLSEVVQGLFPDWSAEFVPPRMAPPQLMGPPADTGLVPVEEEEEEEEGEALRL